MMKWKEESGSLAANSTGSTSWNGFIPRQVAVVVVEGVVTPNLEVSHTKHAH